MKEIITSPQWEKWSGIVDIDKQISADTNLVNTLTLKVGDTIKYKGMDVVIYAVPEKNVVYLRYPSWHDLWRFVLDKTWQNLKTFEVWDKNIFVEYISSDWKRALCKSEYWIELWFFVLDYDGEKIQTIKIWDEEYLISWISLDWNEVIWITKDFKFKKIFKKRENWWMETDSEYYLTYCN